MHKNKEYLFVGIFDVILYILLTIIYPVITYLFQMPDNSNSVYEVLITGLFFTGTFFYDFYSKYESGDDKYAWVLNLLLIGNIVFGSCSLAILVLLILLSFVTKYADQILNLFHLIPILAIYPLVIASVELIKRIIRKHRGKISHVSV